MKLATHISTSHPILKSDTYIYNILPVAANTALAAISSDDSLRLFDYATLQPITAVEQLPGKVHEGVTCLRPFGVGAAADDDGGAVKGGQCVLTAGMDGTVRGWDLRLRGKNFLEIRDQRHAPCLSLDSHGVNVATGAELSNAQASVTMWDYRSTKRPLVEYVESHNDDITELQFHPTNSTRLLSGSMDGLINVYDTTVVDEDDALLHIINHDSSIHHAGFLSEGEIFALSHDESFRVEGLSDQDEESSEQWRVIFGDLRPVLNCDYVVDIIGTHTNEAIVGAGSHSLQNHEYFDLVPLRFDSQWSFTTNQSIRIPGGHGSEIIRSFCFNQPARTVFTAGEDGLIRAWRTPADEGEYDREESEKKYNAGKVGRKRKKIEAEDNKNERQRYRPY